MLLIDPLKPHCSTPGQELIIPAFHTTNTYEAFVTLGTGDGERVGSAPALVGLHLIPERIIGLPSIPGKGYRCSCETGKIR